jgi:hypothetical protein
MTIGPGLGSTPSTVRSGIHIEEEEEVRERGRHVVHAVDRTPTGGDEADPGREPWISSTTTKTAMEISKWNTCCDCAVGEQSINPGVLKPGEATCPCSRGWWGTFIV